MPKMSAVKRPRVNKNLVDTEENDDNDTNEDLDFISITPKPTPKSRILKSTPKAKATPKPSPKVKPVQKFETNGEEEQEQEEEELPIIKPTPTKAKIVLTTPKSKIAPFSLKAKITPKAQPQLQLKENDNEDEDEDEDEELPIIKPSPMKAKVTSITPKASFVTKNRLVSTTPKARIQSTQNNDDEENEQLEELPIIRPTTTKAKIAPISLKAKVAPIVARINQNNQNNNEDNEGDEDQIEQQAPASSSIANTKFKPFTNQLNVNEKKVSNQFNIYEKKVGDNLPVNFKFEKDEKLNTDFSISPKIVYQFEIAPLIYLHVISRSNFIDIDIRKFNSEGFATKNGFSLNPATFNELVSHSENINLFLNKF
eukprot:TRINITY_DN500_c0_g1_i6.p1 TRINITY_DN500_c0_g1~~TRINITY_DN500_c0_g1_i6.p1  ORF type:complete len:369 (+),score=195.44 TRINITY_DN500_c0_g1_i6:162-1268(+)